MTKKFKDLIKNNPDAIESQRFNLQIKKTNYKTAYAKIARDFKRRQQEELKAQLDQSHKEDIDESNSGASDNS